MPIRVIDTFWWRLIDCCCSLSKTAGPTTEGTWQMRRLPMATGVPRFLIPPLLTIRQYERLLEDVLMKYRLQFPFVWTILFLFTGC
ncbi:hypothetical protein CEXT_252411 [Caerostris extrusa]|uniref:Uncharacterized protein n=1 Tax=Caerostris extrusa TaxID=172846 RepID=A0AAV4SIS9_CAEEX|nr:hypothetical protein CEXT_252411 [Caerostris extrusa]